MTPPDTVAFFAGARVDIGELRANDIGVGFFSEQDFNILKENLRYGRTTRTRDLAKLIVDHYGRIDIGKFFPFGLDDRTLVWQRPSEIFAQRCSGEVLAIIGEIGDGEGEIWLNQEKPTLLRNKNVTVIMEIAPERPRVVKQLIFPNGLDGPVKNIIDGCGIQVNTETIDKDAILVFNFYTKQGKKDHKYEMYGRRTIVLMNGHDFSVDPIQTQMRTKPLQLVHNFVFETSSFPKKELELVQCSNFSIKPLQKLRNQKGNSKQTPSDEPNEFSC